jgi:heptosyltransferase-2
MHVAAYVNANVIGLFGPTNGYEWGPLNENGMYIQSPTKDINDIKVEDVFEKAKTILEKH